MESFLNLPLGACFFLWAKFVSANAPLGIGPFVLTKDVSVQEYLADLLFGKPLPLVKR